MSSFVMLRSWVTIFAWTKFREPFFRTSYARNDAKIHQVPFTKRKIKDEKCDKYQGDVRKWTTQNNISFKSCFLVLKKLFNYLDLISEVAAFLAASLIYIASNLLKCVKMQNKRSSVGIFLIRMKCILHSTRMKAI